jgi:hypothetical protein
LSPMEAVHLDNPLTFGAFGGINSTAC